VIVFFKDIGQIVAMIIQFGFWLTPIFWSINIIPQEYHWIIELNPLVYIIEGYRDSLIYHHWFWEKPTEGLYFWMISLAIFLFGAWLFQKLRPHFADVL
jgi:lipopolysaccharide transport system permease protein/teichoic acid transport system permease protein